MRLSWLAVSCSITIALSFQVQAEETATLDVPDWFMKCLSISADAPGAQAREMDCVNLAEHYCRTTREDAAVTPCLEGLERDALARSEALSARLAGSEAPHGFKPREQSLFERRLKRALGGEEYTYTGCGSAGTQGSCGFLEVGLRFVELRSLARQVGLTSDESD
ncbi:hypothetical protein [Marimonas arenosa]|uniref:Lysozyme inhibitor LprI N-terminal domain-containing protein n=1 Tax=Marimonas arenosa TaxID=1795305 RepID=A0AAE4B4W6_9RHOB|nr:hypothetical protein [Marimonas arenosa]MDQ2091473.1 hypothetical protein [Marimonas arenosa]